MLTSPAQASATHRTPLHPHATPAQFTLRPGEFYDLRELGREFKAGTFKPMTLDTPTDGDIARGREVLRELGPKMFGETEAGSWVLGEGVNR